MRTAWVGVALVLLLAWAPSGTTEATKALTNADVVQMVGAGLSESTILLSIQNSPTDFKTAPADLVALQKAGVTQPVLDAMLTRGSAAAVSPATPHGPATAADYSAMAGPQGVVAIDGDRRVELLMASQTASKQKMKLWTNEQTAILPNSRAKIRLGSPSAVFLIPVPPSVDPEQTVRLMKMNIRGDSRETTLRVNSYEVLLRRVPKVTEGVVETTLSPAPGAAANAMMKTFMLSPKAPLDPGEYAVIQYEQQIWDFGVD